MESYIFICTHLYCNPLLCSSLHANTTSFLVQKKERTEMDVFRSARLVFRGKCLSVSHLQRRTLSFQHFKSCAGRKWQNAAYGFWLGSSEQVAFGIANITHTQRDFLRPLTPAVQTYLLHILKQTKTNTERCLISVSFPCILPLLFSWTILPASSSGLLFPPPSSWENNSPPFMATWSPLISILSSFLLSPFLLWDCCCVLWLFIPTWW